tara:strand:- start:38 stop:961 length:924 start_codon:yes stop_codon:yes gene_type:complete
MILRLVILAMLHGLLSACNLVSDRRPADASTSIILATTLREWQPTDTPDAVILGLHSFGDYGAAFDTLGPYFAEAGHLLVSYDQAGFGERSQQGKWAGEKQLVSEAVAQIEHLYERYQRPVFLIGESLGGAVAILAALKVPEKVAGIALAGPAVREGIRLRYGWNAAIASAAFIAPGYRLTVDRQPDDPTLAAHSAQRLANDPRVIRNVRMDSYWGLIQLADNASDRAPALTTPSLLLYGGRDNSVPEAGIQHLRAHLADRGEYRFYPQGPHLLLQGAQWQTVADDILDWIARTRTEIGLTGRAPCC